MRIILIIIFTFISSNVLADKVYKTYGERQKGPFKEKCNGFCEDTELNTHIASAVQKTVRIINGKKKKAPKWVEYRGATAVNTACIPFLSWNERAVPIKVKKSEYEKYMKAFREGTDMYNAYYEINSCIPCPPNVKSKSNKSGFCPIPMFTLTVVMKQAYEYGFVEPMDLSQINIGREITGDTGINFKNSLAGIVFEQLTLSETFKSNLILTRYFDKPSGRRYYIYNVVTYKTAAKQQAIKATEQQFLEDQDLEIYLDTFIDNFQKNFSEVFNIKGKNFKKYDQLYQLIPSEKNIGVIKNSFPKAAKFYIQNRN